MVLADARVTGSMCSLAPTQHEEGVERSAVSSSAAATCRIAAAVCMDGCMYVWMYESYYPLCPSSSSTAIQCSGWRQQ